MYAGWVVVFKKGYGINDIKKDVLKNRLHLFLFFYAKIIVTNIDNEITIKKKIILALIICAFIIILFNNN